MVGLNSSAHTTRTKSSPQSEDQKGYLEYEHAASEDGGRKPGPRGGKGNIGIKNQTSTKHVLEATTEKGPRRTRKTIFIKKTKIKAKQGEGEEKVEDEDGDGDEGNLAH